MAFFVWTDTLSVGNIFIDDDHRHLIALLNTLSDAIGEGRGQDVLGTVLNDLIVYANEHFKREENVMREIGYAEFSEHKAAHDKLTKEVLELQQRHISGETKLTVELLMFLSSWLLEHIMEVDQKMAHAILAAKQEGARRHT
jgi:hemerythrin